MKLRGALPRPTLLAEPIPLTAALHRKIVEGFRRGLYHSSVAKLARISDSHLYDLMRENEALREDVREASALVEAEALEAIRGGVNCAGNQWFLTHRYRNWRSPETKLREKQGPGHLQIGVSVAPAQAKAIEAEDAEWEPLQLEEPKKTE